MISQSYFYNTACHHNFMVGAPVKINNDNGRYSIHRVIDIFPAQNKSNTIIITIELGPDFKPVRKPNGELKYSFWYDKALLKKIQLVTITRFVYGFKITPAKHWEHDILPSFVEQYHLHVN